MKKQTKLFSLILALALVLSGCSLDALDTDSQISSAPLSTVETATPSPPTNSDSHAVTFPNGNAYPNTFTHSYAFTHFVPHTYPNA